MLWFLYSKNLRTSGQFACNSKDNNIFLCCLNLFTLCSSLAHRDLNHLTSHSISFYGIMLRGPTDQYIEFIISILAKPRCAKKSEVSPMDNIHSLFLNISLYKANQPTTIEAKNLKYFFSQPPLKVGQCNLYWWLSGKK